MDVNDKKRWLLTVKVAREKDSRDGSLAEPQRREELRNLKWKIQGSQELCWLRALKLKLATTNSKG